jgi:hypothetical protein
MLTFVQLLGVVMILAFIAWGIAFKFGFEKVGLWSQSVLSFISNFLDDWFR